MITATTGRARDEIVVLTADYSFLSYYPYWGFQGLTSHYANPWPSSTSARPRSRAGPSSRPPSSSSTRWTTCPGRRRRCF
ncbi:arabinofuranosyltransferase AftA domain protein [Mycobacterium xenopi 3993]|nr:arabinofuranosyltransferase AftA domain protein [Mycobacterium xenopi 3993]